LSNFNKLTHVNDLKNSFLLLFMIPRPVRNSSMSLNLTLTRNEKVDYYIRIKTHKLITLRFWVESGVSVLCG